MARFKITVECDLHSSNVVTADYFGALEEKWSSVTNTNKDCCSVKAVSTVAKVECTLPDGSKTMLKSRHKLWAPTLGWKLSGRDIPRNTKFKAL